MIRLIVWLAVGGPILVLLLVGAVWLGWPVGPVLSSVFPRPDGVPAGSTVRYNFKLGMSWSTCFATRSGRTSANRDGNGVLGGVTFMPAARRCMDPPLPYFHWTGGGAFEAELPFIEGDRGWPCGLSSADLARTADFIEAAARAPKWSTGERGGLLQLVGQVRAHPGPHALVARGTRCSIIATRPEEPVYIPPAE